MSSTSEVGSKLDKAQSVKWPHLESHWQTQQFEARERTMKKIDRSHSWWWDSHNSPKSSKWLQENLSEMESKVNAMLKIIEEDADSFSKRAEMFYKRRPELVNLVEEFYRTYRALVERYTFLTREIRQNVPSALRAPLGASADYALNSPVDAHLKFGLDGMDILSPSYSYTGGSEYDDDTPSEVSSRSWKAHIDEEEFSPQGLGSNFDIRVLGSKPKSASLEEENSNEDVYEPGAAVVVDIKQLQINLQNLQEENKALSAKALGYVTNLKNLHRELSSLQSKMKTLEAEDKLAKNRLKAVLEQEQKLEAENLKLNHALITAKEEKTGLAELRKREMEENEARSRRIQQMEGEAVLLKEEILRAQSQALVGLEQVKKLEEENEKLQQAITSVQEEREKDSLDQRQAFELRVQELQERFYLLEKDNVRLKELIATGAADTKRLDDQVMELMKAKRDLSQELQDVQKQNKALEHEKQRADLKSQELQWELEVAQRDGQTLSEQMVQKTAQTEKLQRAICELEAESTRLAIQKMEGSKQVIKLEADIEELQTDRNRLISECQQYEDKCTAFEVTVSRFNEHLASKSAEYAVLRDQKSTNEALVTQAELQVKELQESMSAVYSEKAKLMHELEKALEQVKSIETCSTQMRAEIEESQRQIDKLEQELAVRATNITDLEGTLSCLLQKKDNSEKREAEDRQAIIELRENSSKLGERLEAESADTKRLKERISDLQEERTALGLDIQQTQQRLVGLQEENVALSNQYEKSSADHLAAVKAAKRGEEFLSVHLCEIEKLQDQNVVNRELIHKMDNEIETLRKQLAKSEEENEITGKENENHLKRLADVEGRIRVLEATQSDSLTENAALADQVSDKTRAIEVLEVRLSDLEGERANLMEDVALKSDRTLLLQAQLLASEQQGKSLHSELKKRADVIQSLEAEMKRMQQAISKAEGDNKTLGEHRQRSVQESFLMERKIKDLQEELSHITQEKIALIGELTTITEHCKDLELRIQSLKVDKDAVQKALSAGVLLEDQLKEEVKKLREDNKQLSCTLDAEHKKVQKQERDLQKLQQTLNSSQEKRKEIQDILNAVSEEKDLLERKCGDMQSEMQAQLLASKKQEESLHRQLQNGVDVIRSREAELKGLQQAISTAEGDHKTLVNERQRSMDESSLMEKKIKDLQEELSHLTREKVALVGEVATSTEQCRDLDVRLRSLKVDKDAMQKEFSATLLLKDQLQEKNEHLSGTLDAEMRKVQKQEEDLQNLQKLLISSQEECKAIRDRLKVASEEKDVLERKRGDLQSEMQTQLLASEKQKESLSTRLQNGADMIRSLEAELNRLQQAISKAEGDNKTIVEERQRSMDEGLLTEKKIKDLQEELRHLTQERDALAREVTTSTDQCKDLERRIQNLQVDKDAVQKELSAVILLENQLTEDVRKVQEENNQLSSTLKAEIIKVQKQEDDSQKLQQTLSSSQEEREEVQDKLKVALEEKDDLERKYLVLQEELEENKRAALAATDSLKQLDDKFGRVQQAIAGNEANLSTKAKVISTLEENALKLQNKITHLEEGTERLREALNDTQRANEGLGEQSSKSAADLKDAQTASVYVREELDKQIALGIKLQEEVKSLTDENRGLSQTVSTGATEILRLKNNLGELQQQSDKLSQRHSILQSEKRKLEEAMELLKARVKDLEVVIGGLEDTKQAVLMQHDKDVWQMMLDIKDLRQVLNNRKNKLTASRGVSSANTMAVLSDEQLMEERKKEDVHLQAEQRQASGFASTGSLTSDNKAVPTSTNLPPPSNLQDEADKKILEGPVRSDERERFAAVAARKNEIAKLNKEICNVLEESDVLRSESLAAWMQHHLIGVRAKELQENLSSQQRENVRLSLEVDSFKTEISRLEEEAVILKGENGGLEDKVSATDVEVRKLQGMVSNLQEEGSRFVISLKVKLFSLREEIMLAVEEWKTVVYRIDQTHTSENRSYEQGLTRVEDSSFQQGKEEGKSLAENLDRRSVQEELLPQYWTVQIVLAQLQVRVEEADRVLGGVKILRQIVAKFCQKQREEPSVTEQLEEQQHETISVEEKGFQPIVGPERLHFNLGTRLQCEEMDEKLEHEVRELKECQKHLREELEGRLDTSRRLQTKVEHGKEAVHGGAERKYKKEKLLEKVKQQRQRVEQVISGAAVQEAAAERLEEQVLAKKESATMEGWKEEEVDKLRREMGSIVRLNRKQALELQSVDEELKSLESSLTHAPATTSPLEEEKEEQQQEETEDSRNSSSGLSRFRSLLPQKTQSRRRSSDSSGAYPIRFSSGTLSRRRSSDSSGASPLRSSSSNMAASPLRSSSSNMSALLRVEQLRDKAACWACVGPPPNTPLS